MTLIDPEKLTTARTYIYSNCRLLERQIFAYIFEDAPLDGVIAALAAYQNTDGGFGNGLEPDLLCPASSGISAETALTILDLIGQPVPAIIQPLESWVQANIQGDGSIPHPPADMDKYPHQPWWQGPDRFRGLSIAALLRKLGVENEEITMKARRFIRQNTLPVDVTFYDYPYLLFLRYCSQGSGDEHRLEFQLGKIPEMIEKNLDHYPLMGRYWYHVADLLPEELILQQALAFAEAIEDDGGVRSAYPDLPWWRPIFTLDGLILLRRLSLV